MKPTYLEMTAFGPFKDKEFVNFEELGENPLFLINGPTGSGKTTILDGICYALFGQTTGEDRIAKEMRCHHSKENTLTKVVFNFSLNEKKYSVVRVPEQEVAKKSGDGFTKKGARAELWDLDKDEVLANKSRDVSEKIESLLGLNVSQFRQVMILPQGKFRALLLADSKDREGIFSKLFQTQIYKKIEMNLDNLARDVREKRKSSLERIQGLLEAVNSKDFSEVENKISELAPVVQKKSESLEEEKKEYQKKLQEYHREEKLDKDFERLSEALKMKSTLDQKNDNIEILKESITSIKEAKGLELSITKHKDIEYRKNDVDKRFVSVGENYKSSKVQYKLALKEFSGVDKAKEELDELKKKQVELRELYKVVEKVDKKQKRIREICLELSSKSNELKMREIEVDKVKVNIAAKTSKEEEIVESLKSYQLDKIYEQIGELEKKRELSKSLDSLRSKISLKNTSLKKMSDDKERIDKEVLEKTTHFKSEKIKWHQSMAAILAQDLSDGDKCPVCGSVEHPEVAKLGIDTLSEKELTILEENLNKLNRSLVEIQSNIQGIEREIEALSTEVDGVLKSLSGQTSESLSLEIKSKKDSLQKYEQLSKELEGIKSELKKDSLLLEEFSKVSFNMKGIIDGLEKEREILSKDIKVVSDNIDSSLLDLSNLVAKGKEVSMETENKAKSIIELENQFKAAEISYEKLKKEFEILSEQREKLSHESDKSLCEMNALIAKSRFSDVEEVKSNISKFKAIGELEKEVKEFDKKKNESLAIISELEKSLEGKERKDLEKLSDELSVFKKKLDENTDAFNKVSQELDNYRNIQNKVGTNQEMINQLDSEYKVVGTLADVANGRTANKVSLQRFVLSVLLDDVLREGSRRLKLMSKGRYELIRKTDRARGNKASGLDIEISDTHTGRTRSASTMSGGESFIAALSLALGLSDVVQAYSGGVKLDTLFIDEGFGSLDPESLDLAIRTLIDLQSSGRTVGVISHVEGLKEQMPKRIDIISKADGSSIQV